MSSNVKHLNHLRYIILQQKRQGHILGKTFNCVPKQASIQFTICRGSILQFSSVSCLLRMKTWADLEKMSEEARNAQTIYDFTVQDTYGNDVCLKMYKGYVLLIVNIASRCGLTKNNYEQLTKLKQKYAEKGLQILNFPCNQFASEMPEDDGKAMMCHLSDAKADIGDIFQKIDVNGSGTAPIYQYLKAKHNGTEIDWNFAKFLINREGIPVKRYESTIEPNDIENDIEKLL